MLEPTPTTLSLKNNKHLLVSFLFGGFLLLTLLALCFFFPPDEPDHGRTVVMNIGVFVAGWASGWVAGTLVAPYDKDEATLFSRISKGIWLFVSGYLLAKIDAIFMSLTDTKFIPLSELSMFRIILYMSATVIVMLIVFFARKYSNWHAPSGG